MIVILIDTTVHHHRFLGKLQTYLRQRGHHFYLVRSLEDLRAIESLPGFSPHQARILISGSELHVQDPPPPAALVALLDYVLTTPRYRLTPVLGICFGAQYIARHFGLELHRMKRLLCRRVPVPDLGIRPHFCIHDLPYMSPANVSRAQQEGLEVLGVAILNHHRTIAAFRHRSRPILGTLFHPEALVSTYPILDDFLL